MTEVSNERLVGALDNLRVHQRQLDVDGCEVGVSREALNEVIRAFGELSRRQSPAGVGVKGLEWSAGWGTIKAETLIGHYFIDDNRDGGFKVRLEDNWSSWASSSESAKAAAQADYERRILSSLSVKEPEGVSVAQHVAYFDDGEFHWMSGIAPRNCELYASPPPKAVTISDEMVERVFNAAWDCPHSIDGSAVTLRVDPAKPGNALSQLHQRLRTALSSEAHNGREVE